MRIACNSYSLRHLDRAEALATLATLGFHTTELWVGHASYQSIGLSGQQVARECADHGVRIGAYCIGGLFGLRRPVVDDRLARAFDFARALGVTLVTGTVDPEAADIVDARARRQGVRFGLENHWYTAVSRPQEVLAAIAACSPAVGATVDTGHYAFRGCDLGEVARLLGPRILHVHLKVVRAPHAVMRAVRRWRRQYRMEPALPSDGDGLDRFVGALRAGGYDGLLAVEHEATEQPVDGLRHYHARATLLAGRRGSEACHA